jgi:hypothetical protein
MGAVILKNPALALALGVSILMGVGLPAVWIFTGDIGTDFGVYWRTANNPVAQAYSDEFEYPFPYAPPMLLWIKPLALLSGPLAFALWIAMSLTALAVACRKHLPWPAAALVLISPPLINGLATGQVSAMIAAAMLWACATDKRWLAGFAFGAIASVKPQLVALAPLFFILTRDWRALFGSAASFLAILGLTLLVFGASVWAEWFDGLGYFRAVLNERSIIGSVPTLAGQAEWWGLPALPFWLLGVGIGAWLVATCRNGGPLQNCAVIAAGSLFAAPYALTYDLAPVIPFLVGAVFAGHIAAAVAMSGALHPLPLLLAAFELGGFRGQKDSPGNTGGGHDRGPVALIGRRRVFALRARERGGWDGEGA